MKGIYCLSIKILKTKEISIGRLGKIKFEKGRYIYVGSAQKTLERGLKGTSKRKRKNFGI